VDALIARDEDASVIGSPDQEILVVLAFTKDIDRTHDVPPPGPERFHDLLPNVVVREERKTGH
jgi:hypothetical protein